MSKTRIGDLIQIGDRFHCSRSPFPKGVKLANSARRKKEKSESKTDENEDEITEKGLEEESADESDDESHA